LRPAERRQRELVDFTNDELLPEPLERRVAERRLHGAERAENQPRLCATALREQPQKVDARRIGPVQIFEQQHERALAREDTERVHELAEHALAGGARRFALELAQHVSFAEHTGELEAPRRREPAHDPACVLAVRPGEQGVERLEKRPIGFTGAERLETATPRDPDRKSTRLNSSHVKISYAVF